MSKLVSFFPLFPNNNYTYEYKIGRPNDYFQFSLQDSWQQNNYFQKMNIFHIIMNYTSSNAGTGKYNSTGK